MVEAAIRAEGLAKTFRVGFMRRKVHALLDGSFEVPNGCVFGLVGPNGAGKSTTIKILMGLLRPTKGKASIDGFDISDLRARRQLGFLPENPTFYDHLKPHEFLTFVASLYGLSARKSRGKAEELLEFVGLSHAINRPIRKFSKGMVQRLGLAQALVHEPRIVVLDEPQSGLDPIGRKEVKDMIRDLKAKGRTVFFSSHILHDVEDVCDEVALMILGKVIDKGRVETLVSAEVIETELEVAGVEAPLLEELAKKSRRSQTLETSTQLTFDASVDISSIVQQVASSGGSVLRLVPHRESLEDIFVREAKLGGPDQR